MYNFIRGLIVLLGTTIGVVLGYNFSHFTLPEFQNSLGEQTPLKAAMIFGGIGYLICSILTRDFQIWLQEKVAKLNVLTLIFGVSGGVLGLLVANFIVGIPILIFLPVDRLGGKMSIFNSILPFIKVSIPLIINLLFCFIGSLILTSRQDKILETFDPHLFRFGSSNLSVNNKLIDSSTLIDGRILDLINLGLMDGDFLIPDFVINELDLISDSSDLIKKKRGERGKEIYESLKKRKKIQIRIVEDLLISSSSVSEKLIEMALKFKAQIITCDMNLKKIALMSNVNAMNINDISNAIKPLALPGEALEVKVLKEGKEKEQGIGYLDDGTMVVVENGREFVDKTVHATVTSVLQTSAGRMIFVRV